MRATIVELTLTVLAIATERLAIEKRRDDYFRGWVDGFNQGRAEVSS